MGSVSTTTLPHHWSAGSLTTYIIIANVQVDLLIKQTESNKLEGFLGANA
jgi:hypothetical protein